MTDVVFSFREIRDINDNLLLPWLDLYEISFPPDEKMLVSSILKILKEKPSGKSKDTIILSALDDKGEFLGLALYDVVPDCEAAFLWYFAVKPEARSKGIGAHFYHEILRRLKSFHLKAAIFEVEIPEEAHTPDGGEWAKRRINFYKRQGALLMGGIHYEQSVGPHQPTIPMHIMVHPLATCTPEEAYEISSIYFKDRIKRVGEITLN